MAKNPQWRVRLDPYHRFVVEQFEDVFGSSRSEVLQTMIRQWVSDHSDQVTQAGASIEAWRAREENKGQADQG